MKLRMKNKNLEFELVKDLTYSIVKQEHKDIVRTKYNNYMNYLNKGGVDFNKKLFDYVHKKYVNYMTGNKLMKKRNEKQ